MQRYTHKRRGDPQYNSTMSGSCGDWTLLNTAQNRIPMLRAANRQSRIGTLNHGHPNYQYTVLQYITKPGTWKTNDTSSHQRTPWARPGTDAQLRFLLGPEGICGLPKTDTSQPKVLKFGRPSQSSHHFGGNPWKYTRHCWALWTGGDNKT